MDTVAKIRKFDGFKDIGIRELAAGNFTKPRKQLISYRKSLNRTEGQIRLLTQQINQTQARIEELRRQGLSTESSEERIQIASKIDELKKSLEMNAEGLRKYQSESAALNAEVSKRDSELKQAEQLSKDVKNELLVEAAAQGANLILPGSGFFVKHWKAIAIIIGIIALFLFAIIFSVIKATDSPGATIETIINTQCADTTDPNCVSKFIENSVDKQLENRN
jgi:hypothetical protein